MGILTSDKCFTYFPGVYSEILENRAFRAVQRIYAHRKYTRLFVTEVDLEFYDPSVPLKLRLKLNKWKVSKDITFIIRQSGMEEVRYCNIQVVLSITTFFDYL